MIDQLSELSNRNASKLSIMDSVITVKGTSRKAVTEKESIYGVSKPLILLMKKKIPSYIKKIDMGASMIRTDCSRSFDSEILQTGWKPVIFSMKHKQRILCELEIHEFGHIRGHETDCMWCQKPPTTFF